MRRLRRRWLIAIVLTVFLLVFFLLRLLISSNDVSARLARFFSGEPSSVGDILDELPPEIRSIMIEHMPDPNWIFISCDALLMQKDVSVRVLGCMIDPEGGNAIIGSMVRQDEEGSVSWQLRLLTQEDRTGIDDDPVVTRIDDVWLHAYSSDGVIDALDGRLMVELVIEENGSAIAWQAVGIEFPLSE